MDDSVDIDDEAVAAMVRACRPDWTVESLERSGYGTDLVCFLTCGTPGGRREAVLKATTVDLVPPEIARSEPRLLELVGRETSVPVPDVYGSVDAHEEYPAPFYLMERIEGENFQGRPGALPAAARDRVVAEAGRNLAALHEVGRLPAVGAVGVRDGDLAVLDTDEYPRYDDTRTWLLSNCEDALASLEDGGWFPELADRPDRFADLVPALGDYLREAIPALPDPDPPAYCHWDYRYGNLLVDPDSGETRAVLDWANLRAADPAYNLAKAESHLFDPTAEDDDRVADLRRQFRTAYENARPDWMLDDAARERIETYRLTCRIDAMACLPLWLENATPTERDERERQHREFVADYLK